MKNEDFPSKLQARIATDDISQTDLSRLSGVSQGTLSKILHGKKNAIRLSTAIKLWPFVYGCEFPDMPATTPADSSHAR